ncbi:casein kinase (macronuclear) [Tetrahymena thermophila SB210]|uniref:Casein kinase I n=1 Tax=Tetrahymena thermophila (strain SB210) TaxID=312017 RepID=Q22CG0_TETTS|nr:casein kinase [Tetrahymena thermophila SB210]EAR82969.2 casein kinase [Tetrahymena thermophila SB210]|eukprot:XP_001030632.2 casein kinase [Tetrahymena thermophila SB210]
MHNNIISENNPAFKKEKDDTIWQKWIGQVVCRHYEILEKLDQGSFGYVFKARRQKDPNNKHINSQGDDLYAVKIEDNTSKNQDTLTKEAKILYDLKAEKGFTRMYYYIKNDKINIMVTTLLDKSLDKLFNICKKKFTLKTVLMIADQMLTRLQHFHSRGYVHRDIKPDNFMIGRGVEKNQIFLIDFGLSKSYLKKNGAHIDFSEKVGLVGTTRYTSVQSHLGMEQSRRDDLESLGYTLIFFLKGTLPWMNLKSRNKSEHQKLISQVKMKTPLLELCKDLPVEFNKYMTYVKSLGFFDEPNYNYLKKLFRTLFLKENFQYDDKFDWIKDEPNCANDKRNMFEKFKSVNPMPAIKIENNFIDNYHREDSPKNQEVDNYPQESKINNNTLEVGFKRKNTRKSTQEYIKKVELQIKDEDEESYKEELADNVNDLSNQISKVARLHAEVESSDYDQNRNTSNTINSNNLAKKFANCDKTSTTEMNDFEFDLGDDVVAEEDETHVVDKMVRTLAQVQMRIKRFKQLQKKRSTSYNH